MNNRWVATRGTVTVAVLGAVVSYMHIYSLARTAAQPILSAVLYPGIVDALVAVTSVCVLHAVRTHRRVRFPAAVFTVAVLATLAANVADGARQGVLAGVVAGWPAVAYVGALVLVHWLDNDQVSGLHELPAQVPAQPLMDDSSISGLPLEQAMASNGAAPDSTITAPDDQGAVIASNGAVLDEPGAVPDSTASKTERVWAALTDARGAGENPTAAELARRTAVSESLARKVVRASQNGHEPEELELADG